VVLLLHEDDLRDVACPQALVDWRQRR
jgi:hypothetical protein